MKTLFYKRGQVARMLGVSTKTLERWEKDVASDFPMPVYVGKTAMYKVAEVNGYLREKDAERNQRVVEMRQRARFKDALAS